MKTNEKRHNRSRENGVKIVRIEFSHPTAKSVGIAGSFNDWRPESTEMIALGNDKWRKDLALPSGTHEYLLVVDGQWISDPAVSETIPNSYGGVNSVIHVAETDGHIMMA